MDRERKIIYGKCIMRMFNETNEIYEIWNLFVELVLLAESGKKKC